MNQEVKEQNTDELESDNNNIESIEDKAKENRERFISKNILKISNKIKFLTLIILTIVLILSGILMLNKIKTKEILLDFGFRDVGFLVTQEWYGKMLEVSSKDRKLFDTISIPFTESKIIFSMDIEVLAGINFEKIEYKIIEENKKKKIIINLPHSVIYKKYPVDGTFESYLESESWFTNINSKDQQKLRDNITQEGEKKAIESGILNKADENAKRIITNMIKANKSTKDYEIEFKYE
jgi:hypothetical protein